MKTTEQKILDFATEQWGYKDLKGIALKLAEESGEIAGACIKIDDLDKELGDSLIVISQLAARRGRTIEDLRTYRFRQIQERAAILDSENAQSDSR